MLSQTTLAKPLGFFNSIRLSRTQPSSLYLNICDMIEQMCYAMMCFRASDKNPNLRAGLKGIKNELNEKATDVENVAILINAFKGLINKYKDQASALIHVIIFFRDYILAITSVGTEIDTLCESDYRLKQLFSNFLKSIDNFELTTEERNEYEKKFMVRVRRLATNNEISEGPSAVIPIGRKYREDRSSGSDDSDGIQNPTIIELRERNYVISDVKTEPHANSLLKDFKRLAVLICGKNICEWAEYYNANRTYKVELNSLLNQENEEIQELILKYALYQMYLGYGKKRIEKDWEHDPETKKRWNEFSNNESKQSAKVFYDKVNLIYAQDIFGFALDFLMTATGGNCYVSELKDAKLRYRYSNLFLDDGGKVCADCFCLVTEVGRPAIGNGKGETIFEEKVCKFEEPGIIYHHASYDVNEEAFVLEILKAAGADPYFNRFLRAIINNNIDEIFESVNVHNSERIISLKHFISVIAIVHKELQMGCANLPDELQPKKQSFHSSFSDKLLELQAIAIGKLTGLNVRTLDPTPDETKRIKKLFYEHLPCKATEGEEYIEAEVQERPRSSSILSRLFTQQPEGRPRSDSQQSEGKSVQRRESSADLRQSGRPRSDSQLSEGAPVHRTQSSNLQSGRRRRDTHLSGGGFRTYIPEPRSRSSSTPPLPETPQKPPPLHSKTSSPLVFPQFRC